MIQETRALSPQSQVSRRDGVVIGTVAEVGAGGRILLDFPANPSGQAVPAQILGDRNRYRRGQAVALLFADGDPRRPVVFGPLEEPLPGPPEPSPPARTDHSPPVEVSADHERLEIAAEKEIVLRCGRASITLTRAGKILLRGAYLLSRSSGANRIKGGSVQIN